VHTFTALRRDFDRRNLKRVAVGICTVLNRFSFLTELQIALPAADIVFGPNRELRTTEMITDGTRDFSPPDTAWLRKPVALLVVIRRCHVPFPCSIVGESATALRVRFDPGCEMDLRKELILAVEEKPVFLDSRVN
jgi:hypothetical protein